MGGYEHPVPSQHARLDLNVEVRLHAADGGLKALGEREVVLADVPVSVLEGGIAAI